MIVVCKLDPETYQKVKEFVRKGAYDSVENFVEIAVLNQILLESQGVRNAEEDKTRTEGDDQQLDLKSFKTRQKAGEQNYIQYLVCPKDISVPVLQSEPMSEEIRGSPLWGQINRLAPVKIVLRMLTNRLVISGNDHVDLKEFSATVAENVSLIRALIEKKDKIVRIRGEEQYVALAKKDPRSQQRFINFYIGKLPTGKWTDGALTGLGLAMIGQSEDGNVIIGLTEAGRTFAFLFSPLIDDFLLEQKQIENPLSNEEIDFLLHQLKANRPGEFEYVISVLNFVKEGADSPTTLCQKVSKFLHEKGLAINISDKVVNTMQVGVIGRLVEMRLLAIQKNAQKSKYHVTNSGEDLLKREVKV